MNSQQLSLFGAAPQRGVLNRLGPHPEGPDASAPRQVLSGGLIARVQAETGGELHYYIYQGSTWIGTLFHVGQSLWSIYLPGEHGVAEFGGPTLRKAAQQLATLVASGKELANA
ncbi:hypothetical protein HER32_11850 [Hymenobacter sp. BT18]|uniref:hypothetical protein n=1 Tax=Hymenobacter sp. BT18 TaxID=2835648 RepID=UPI00143E78DC|nr:hypothetical protein [Hymenobacter sp. BT18]QIX61835.1 hypothetical protein HER32_11850 [Hymenobacter sp. BT18]